MSVIVLDDICNLNCDYCFYSTVLGEKRDDLIKSGKLNKDSIYFNKEYVKKLANKLVDSHFEIDLGKQSVVITGGEPTMHPEFIELMKYFIQKGLTIHLLTNFVFQPHGKVYDFLMKNKKHFRFLVNFNEISRQPSSKITKQNLIDFDYEYIKVGVNLYHTNYNFDDIIDIFKNTKNIHIIRLGLPNSQADEGINMGVLKAMKEDGYSDEKIEQLKNKYKKDLFQSDYDQILSTGKGISYGLLDEEIYSFYKEKLGKELQRFISLLKENNLENRIEYYIDCGFDYKILPEDVCGFLLQRLYYKNPCSIPNGVCIQTGGQVQQCYSIGTYGNFTKEELSIKGKSIREINNYYLLSSLFLQFGLLNQIKENNFEMCRGNNLRFFKQLFTTGTFNTGEFVLKDYNISKRGDEKIGYQLKNVSELTKKYLQGFKDTKNTLFVIRIFQLFEYCITHFYFEEAKIILEKLYFIQVQENIQDRLNFYIHYYQILLNFLIQLKEYTILKKYENIEQLRIEKLKEIEELEIFFNERIGEQPSNQLYKLSTITKTIIKKQIYID